MPKIHVLTDADDPCKEDINETFYIDYVDLIDHVLDLKRCSNINITNSVKLIAVSNSKLLQITLIDSNPVTWKEIFDLIEKENIVPWCV